MRQRSSITPSFHPGGPSRHAGLTILEAVVYISILAIVSVAIVSVLLDLGTAYNRSRSKRLANTNGAAAMERMIREIRLANDIDFVTSVLNAHPGALALDTVMSSSDTTPTTRRFSIQNDTLMLQEGGGAAAPLTAGVRVTNLVFSSTTTPFFSLAVHIAFTVESGSGKLKVSIPFSDTAILRGSY